MMAKPEVVPPTPGAHSDEDFFKEHNITDEDDKEAFRKRYLLKKYEAFREAAEKPPEKKKKRGFLD